MEHRQFLCQQFGLINPLHVSESAWCDLPTEKLGVIEFGVKSIHLPRLVDFRKMSAVDKLKLLDRSLAWDRSHPTTKFFCALLQSRSEAQEISSHLSRQLLISMPDRSVALFRFYDPSVFRHLVWLLRSDQLESILGPISKWTWQSVAGDWREINCDASRRKNGLGLCAEQLGTLTRIGVLNRALLQLEESKPDHGCDPQYIDSLLNRAYVEWGFVNEADCILFIEHSLRFGECFDQLPIFNARLKLVQQGLCSYVAASIDESVSEHKLSEDT
ncbi:MAG: DUF4123 domain-containing protein [Stenotrophomonas sp.]